MPSSATPVKQLLDGTDLVAIDVGARGDVPPHWQVLDGTARVISFEADEAACRQLHEVYARRGHGDMYRVLPVCLSGTGGRQTLYVRHVPSSASLKEPLAENLDAYYKHDYIFPITPHAIESRTLADVLGEIGENSPDMIKLDIEGSELDVLEGMGDARIASLVAIEMEAPILDMYREQRSFAEAVTALSRRGFDLFDVHVHHGQRTLDGETDGYQRQVFGVYRRSPSMSARALYTDLLFFRQAQDVVASRSIAGVRKLAVAYCTYGFFPEAHHLIARALAAGLLPAAQAGAAEQAIIAWHRRRGYKTRHGLGLWSRIVRYVIMRLRIEDYPNWGQ